jgi:hypothetical protein
MFELFLHPPHSWYLGSVVNAFLLQQSLTKSGEMVCVVLAVDCHAPVEKCHVQSLESPASVAVIKAEVVASTVFYVEVFWKKCSLDLNVPTSRSITDHSMHVNSLSRMPHLLR